MCIIIYKPENIILSKNTLMTSYDWNIDGVGYMYWDSECNRLVIKKGFFDFDSFYKSYKKHQYKRCVIHFRKVTHGVVNEENCHPFVVNDNLAFVHNGVISNTKIYKKERSDTWHFNECILKPMVSDYPDIWKHKTFKYLIQNYIRKSKLVFMNNLGEVKIYNESYGIWESGCWFSNDYYQYDLENIISSVELSKNSAIR